ncbi:MAG: hypothetical protein ABIJ42_06215 [Acidobacteriota bacterium]
MPKKIYFRSCTKPVDFSRIPSTGKKYQGEQLTNFVEIQGYYNYFLYK